MTEEPQNEPDGGDDTEFDRVLRNLVNTPHKPHAPEKSKPKAPDNEREAS